MNAYEVGGLTARVFLLYVALAMNRDGNGIFPAWAEGGWLYFPIVTGQRGDIGLHHKLHHDGQRMEFGL
jgi:hypothetical protein